MRILITIPLLFLISSCTLSEFRAKFRNQRYGYPLLFFKSDDGKYFPKFINDFFNGSVKYTKNYPSIEQASSGFKLIEVKPLLKDKQPYNQANLSWSADGAWLSYEMQKGNHKEIRIMDLHGLSSQKLLDIPRPSRPYLAATFPGSFQSFSSGLNWSKNSTQFSFMANNRSGEYNIYVGAVGSTEEPLTQNQGKNGYSVWNPKLNEIAFTSSRSGKGDIYIINTINKKISQISSNSETDIFPEWIPNGHTIVWCSGSGRGYRILMSRRNPKTGRWNPPSAITNATFSYLRPTVSPNGRYISFYSDSGKFKNMRPTWNIHVVPLEGETRYSDKQIAQMVIAKDVVVDLNTGPTWSPNSSSIFYVKRSNKYFNPIFNYNIITGDRYHLKTNTKMNRDLMISKLGVLSFRAMQGPWDRVFLALTNQGLQLQKVNNTESRIHYLSL
ncbi:MAG: hypothetical protein CMP10_06505 [Zetaproteobacteria bacterium]|nr:hypothetical protein [Pseudobdellovibrionaceae bacterium]